jgi:hypothetical protein
MAFVSPNDVLCPVVTYVFVSVYGGSAGISGGPGWPRVRALLTVVSLVVNIVTIMADGLRHLHHPGDQKQREASRPVLDALYAYCEPRVQAKSA